MATAAKAVEYPHIVKTAGVRGGKARIEGTRICVVDIVTLHHQGLKPEQMLEHYSSRPLTLAEVHASLAYYYDHKGEIDAYFEESRRAAEQLEAPDAPSTLRVSPVDSARPLPPSQMRTSTGH